MKWSFPIILFVVMTLASCAVVPSHRMRTGAVAPTTAQRVVLMPATCSSVKDACRDEYAQGAQGILMQELEFAGYSVVDAATLAMDARSRADASAELRLFGEKVAGAKSLRQRGSIFEDLPPSARRALLTEAKGQGILTLRINITSHPSIMANIIDVSVRYGVGEDGAELGWVSQCTREPKMFSAAASLSTEIEQTTQCAVRKALGR